MKSYSKYVKNNIKIYPIREVYIFPNVQFGNLKVIESLTFQPGEVWFDDNGLVRLFSVKYSNKSRGDYFLYHKNVPLAFIYETLNSDILSFGLKLLGESIVHGSTVVHNIGKYLYKKASDETERTISNILEDLNTANLGYIELKSKEVVINHLISMKMGSPIRELQFVVENPNEIDLYYETSRDGKLWKAYPVKAKSFDKFYFGNGQSYGFFRIKTQQSDFQTYKIIAPNTYSIYWNNRKDCWDLSLT